MRGVGPGNTADCLSNISGCVSPPGPAHPGLDEVAREKPSSSNSPRYVEVPAQVIPSLSREACQGPLGAPLTRGASSQQAAATWYPDIRANHPTHLVKFTPGYGEAHANCGDVRFAIVCPTDSKHYKRLRKENCKRPGCPVCWSGWAARAASDAAKRIDGCREANNSNLLSRHVSIHPPEHIEDLQELLDKGRKAATYLGITAAAVIPHHDRLRPDVKDLCEAESLKTGQNRYEWALAQPNWPDLVQDASHLHMLVYGPLIDSETFFKKTGWTYRNHDAGPDGHGGKDSGRTGEELKKTLYYLLSHAWVRGNNSVVRYWMGMHSSRLSCTDLGTRPAQTEPCPVCATDLVKTPPDIVWGDGTVHPFYQDLHNAPVYLVKVHIYRYEVRHKVRTKRTKVSATAQLIWGPDGPPVRAS